uniref:Chemokine interleukin-8-like domain-containing protein n=1 Tax=Oreochromis aureus TaxID=47969 RepID=A0AAZ1X875_OREAU
ANPEAPPQISMRCCRGVSTNGPTVSRKYCCTRYQQKPVPVKWLKSYTVQDDNCNIRAIIFKTVKNRHICANPEDKWVNIALKPKKEMKKFITAPTQSTQCRSPSD